MRNDDLRTLAYRALEELGHTVDGLTHQSVRGLFVQARKGGLLDFDNAPNGSIRVFPIATKPAAQVAGVIGIDAHRGMGEPS